MSESAVKISVVVPTYNRPEALKKCLAALQQQTVAASWEIIVVDDGGKSALDSVVSPFQKHLNLRLIRQENSGPATARNQGAFAAKGEYVAFVDDDCEPEKDWLKQLIPQASKGVMVGGKTINKLSTNPYSEVSQALVTFLYQYFENSPWYFFTSNNFLLDKESFVKIGGFDQGFRTSAGEDREFCIRWTHAGNTMSTNERAIILHSHHQASRSFWKMHFKYGRAAFDFTKKIEHLGVPPLKPKLSFYSQLFRLILQQCEPKGAMKLYLIFLIFISQLATFLGYFRERLGSMFRSKNDKVN